MSKPKQTDDKVIEELAKWLRFFDEYPTIKRAEELKADVEKLWGETVGANNEAPYLDWAKLFYTKLPSLGYEKVDRAVTQGLTERTLTDYVNGKVTFERLAEELGLNFYSLHQAFLHFAKSSNRAIERAAMERVFKEIEDKLAAIDYTGRKRSVSFVLESSAWKYLKSSLLGCKAK
jgi:hypothetical protein